MAGPYGWQRTIVRDGSAALVWSHCRWCRRCRWRARGRGRGRAPAGRAVSSSSARWPARPTNCLDDLLSKSAPATDPFRFYRAPSKRANWQPHLAWLETTAVRGIRSCWFQSRRLGCMGNAAQDLLGQATVPHWTFYAAAAGKRGGGPEPRPDSFVRSDLILWPCPPLGCNSPVSPLSQ
jgi:hypothetical protein